MLKLCTVILHLHWSKDALLLMKLNTALVAVATSNYCNLLQVTENVKGLDLLTDLHLEIVLRRRGKSGVLKNEGGRGAKPSCAYEHMQALV